MDTRRKIRRSRCKPFVTEILLSKGVQNTAPRAMRATFLRAHRRVMDLVARGTMEPAQPAPLRLATPHLQPRIRMVPRCVQRNLVPNRLRVTQGRQWTSSVKIISRITLLVVKITALVYAAAIQKVNCARSASLDKQKKTIAKTIPLSVFSFAVMSVRAAKQWTH